MPNLSGTKFGPVFDGHSFACAWKLGVCLRTLQMFQATPFPQNAPIPPSEPPRAIDANNVAEGMAFHGIGTLSCRYANS